MSLFDGSAGGFCCRICIALLGLEGQDVAKRAMTEADAREHIKRVHPR